MALACAAPAAASTSYHPNPDSRAFGTSAGGWAGESTNDGLLCIDGATCPAVSQDFVSTDGVGGAQDGFLRTHVEGLASVLTTTTSTFTGPEFVYNGDAGGVPDKLTLTLDRRVIGAELLEVLDEATYEVIADNLDTGASATLAGPIDIDEEQGWTPAAPVTIDPEALKRGATYRLRIVTEFEIPAGVIPAGDFDYDNVALTAATRGATGNDGGNGGGGNGGNGGNGGSVSAAQLAAGITGATVKNGKVVVKLRCPKSADKACKYSLVGRAKSAKSAKVTAGKLKAKVRPGKKAKATAKIKPAFKQQVESKRKLRFTGKAKSGKTKTKINKRLKLSH
jgi:hypothetical protein